MAAADPARGPVPLRDGWTAESLASLGKAFLRDDTLPAEAISVGVIARLRQEVMDAFVAAREGPAREVVQEMA